MGAHQPSHRRVALDAAEQVVLGMGEHRAFLLLAGKYLDD
jgi:hypothetical protein